MLRLFLQVGAERLGSLDELRGIIQVLLVIGLDDLFGLQFAVRQPHRLLLIRLLREGYLGAGRAKEKQHQAARQQVAQTHIVIITAT